MIEPPSINTHEVEIMMRLVEVNRSPLGQLQAQINISPFAEAASMTFNQVPYSIKSYKNLTKA